MKTEELYKEKEDRSSGSTPSVGLPLLVFCVEPFLNVELEILIFIDTEATESSRLEVKGRMIGFLHLGLQLPIIVYKEKFKSIGFYESRR